MLPGLKAKQLQNWSNRGVLDTGDQKPGKGLRRKYTPAGVIALDFMQEATLFGIPPANARQMADEYVAAADEFLGSNPEVITKADGCRWIPVTPEKMESFRKGRITRISDSEYHLFVERRDGVIPFEDRFSTIFHVALEVDYRVAMAVNRMFLLECGQI
ncbi:hypothetical protein [Hoeflea sp.]|uniref:hypothetical protein n=1 Tax=Hoeflea sp. TaxID=1940281 RepID=UPI0025C57FC9|nr:hypothetical protein [Hoeflea sp.]